MRILLTILVILSVFIPLIHHTTHARQLSLVADERLLRQATDLKHPLTWLRRQPAVRDALLGPDHRTIAIYLRDGLTEVILPSASSTPLTTFHIPHAGNTFHKTTSLISEVATSTITPSPTPSTSGPQALVLAPFATQFTQIGAHSTADQVAALLRQEGYQTTELKDADVTVDVMKTLANYQVVYITSHATVMPDGRVIIATGQKAGKDGGPYSSEISNGDMIIGSVDGDPTRTLYYVIAPGFVQKYEGQFMPHAFIAALGCDTLSNLSLYDAFAAHGVSTYTGWEGYVIPVDQERAGEALMIDMVVKRMTALAAVESLVQSGVGQSYFNGAPTRLALVGDASYILQPEQLTITPTPTATSLSSPTVSPVTTGTTTPSPLATSTVTATPTPTSSPTATPTATTKPTPTPLSLDWHKVSVHVKPARIHVGHTTTVTVKVSAPGFIIVNAPVTLDGRGVRAGLHVRYTNRHGIARFREHPQSDGLIFGNVKRPHLKPKTFFVHVVP